MVVLGAQSLASDGAFKFHPDPDEKEARRSEQSRRNVVLTQRKTGVPTDYPQMTTEVVSFRHAQCLAGCKLDDIDKW